MRHYYGIFFLRQINNFQNIPIIITVFSFFVHRLVAMSLLAPRFSPATLTIICNNQKWVTKVVHSSEFSIWNLIPIKYYLFADSGCSANWCAHYFQIYHTIFEQWNLTRRRQTSTITAVIYSHIDSIDILLNIFLIKIFRFSSGWMIESLAQIFKRIAHRTQTNGHILKIVILK